MPDGGSSDDGSRRQACTLLERALDAQYAFIYHYPRLARLMPSTEVAQRVRVLGRDSLKQADVLSQIVKALGGTPPAPSAPPLPAAPDLEQFFQEQLEKEKLGFSCQVSALALVHGDIAESLRRVAQQEQWHIRLTERVLAALDGAGSGPS